MVSLVTRNRPIPDGLLPAILLQKAENVLGPHGASQIREAVSFLRGCSKRGIDFHLGYFAGVCHRRREGAAGRKIVIVLRLEKENRRMRIADSADHQRL